MANSYPYGYGSEKVTQEQLNAKKTYRLLHPEVRRRFQALIEHLAAKGVPLGVGTGWRVQPQNKKGFAKPGNSYHEAFPAGTENANAMAIDTVPSSSWNQMELVLDDFGLRSFRNVNNEPWHIQPIEIPGSRRYATSPPPLKTWKLPGNPPPAQNVPPSGPTTVAPSLPKPTLRKGDSGLGVRQLIDVLKFWKWYPAANINDGNDGKFGTRTEVGVKAMQSSLGVSHDGIYGPQTAKALGVFVTAAKKGA